MYAIRRVDTRQLFMGFKGLSLGKMEVQWTKTSYAVGCVQLALYDTPDIEMLDDIKRQENIVAIFVPVTIGG